MERTYTWIKGIIDSCLTPDHIDCVDLLIEFFEKKYKSEDELITKLKTSRHERWASIHNISL